MKQSKLSKNDTQQMYSTAIQILFNGTVQADPKDITKQVIKDVDTMIGEIANCSQNIAQIGIDVVYKAVAERGIVAIKRLFYDNLLLDMLVDKATKKPQEQIKSLFENWVKKLMGDRRFVGCLYQARNNWRSKIQMELLGI